MAGSSSTMRMRLMKSFHRLQPALLRRRRFGLEVLEQPRLGIRGGGGVIDGTRDNDFAPVWADSHLSHDGVQGEFAHALRFTASRRCPKQSILAGRIPIVKIEPVAVEGKSEVDITISNRRVYSETYSLPRCGQN